MENKATKKFLFISLGLLALVMALTPVLAGPVTEAYWYATYMKAIPLVAIYALPALISLISIPVVSIWHRKWLYRWDKISLIANIAITVCIVLLSAIWLAGALGFDRSELMVSFVPAVLVLVSSLLLGLSVGMLISAVQGIKRSRRDIPAGERTPVTYSQMFAVCWFMASVLFLLFGVVAAFAGSEIVTGEFMMNVLVFGGYFALVVAACAGLFYLIGILWHKSKGVAALLIVITVLLAIATFVIYLFTVNMRNNYLGYSYRDEPQWYDQVHGRYADYTHYGAGNPLPEEESGVVIRSDDMDYDYAEEYGEYYNDEWSEKFGSTVNIAGLWNNRGEVGDSVSAALAYAVDNINISHMADDAPWQMMPWLDWYAGSYYEEIRPGGQGSEAYWRITNFLFRRSCQISIYELFESYEGLIKRLLSAERYSATGLRRTVELLMASYEDISYYGEDAFIEVYRLMSDEDIDWSDSCDKLINDYVSESSASIYVWGDEGALDRSLIMWGYSFWGRRANECTGNPEDIYKVLAALDRMYPES